MIKLYLTILSIVLVSLTVAIGVIKPDINKPVQFQTSDFKLAAAPSTQTPAETTPSQKVEIQNSESIQTKTIEKTIETTIPKTKETTKIIEQKPQVSTKTIEVQKSKDQTKTVTKTVQSEHLKTTTKTKTITKEQPKTTTITHETELPKSVKEIVKTNPQQPPVKEKTQQAAPPEPVKTVQQPSQKPVELPRIESKPIEQMTPAEIIKQAEKEDRLLTEREELVVWNVWRSNLQNQIMNDTQISAPLGTVFKFSFTVDKRGRISNLRTWAIPSIYNSVAINYLKPLIQSYQGKPILTFPSRTKRVITNVTGGFTISTEDKFSTPDDFSDIERIKTTR